MSDPLRGEVAAATRSPPASCAASPSTSPADAAALGCAAAAQVAQGLGTDHGCYDLAAVRAFQESATLRT